MEDTNGAEFYTIFRKTNKQQFKYKGKRRNNPKHQSNKRTKHTTDMFNKSGIMNNNDEITISKERILQCRFQSEEITR